MEQRINPDPKLPEEMHNTWEGRCEQRLRAAYNRFGPQRFMSALSRVMDDAGLLTEADNGTKG